MIEYTSVMQHPLKGNCFALVGKDRSNGAEVHSWVFFDALRWRMAEYGLADTEVDVAFKMVFSESLSAVDPQLVEGIKEPEPIPLRVSAANARPAKANRMSFISGKQNAKLHQVPLVPPNDRVELYQQAMDLIAEPIVGRELEHKRLIAGAYRAPSDYMTHLKYDQAIKLFDRGDANTVADALRLGEEEAKRRISVKQQGGR